MIAPRNSLLDGTRPTIKGLRRELAGETLDIGAFTRTYALDKLTAAGQELALARDISRSARVSEQDTPGIRRQASSLLKNSAGRYNAAARDLVAVGDVLSDDGAHRYNGVLSKTTLRLRNAAKAQMERAKRITEPV